MAATHPRVVEFDVPMQGLPCGVDHRSAQFVQHHPGRFVAPQPELTLDQECRDAPLVGRHQVRGPKPLGERRLCIVQNRAGRQRYLVPALGALPASIRDHVGPPMLAAGTDEAVRPAASRQILLAGLLGGELASELVQILREWWPRHAPTQYRLWQAETTGYRVGKSLEEACRADVVERRA